MALTGNKVVLRPPGSDDIEVLTGIFQEREVSHWWPRFDRERIERELVVNDDPHMTVYVVEVDHQALGIVQYYEESDPDYRHAAIDIAIGTRWHGTGVALDALRTLCRDLIERRGHHHLTIDPAAANTRAIACYKKVGFRPVGVLRENERGQDGSFHDALLMDLVADDLR
jgi:aminoglycoside 6'-N-acetyltransferase